MTEISVATYSINSGDNGEQVSVVFSDGTTETITDKHANYKAIVQALINKPEGYGPVVYDLANIAKTVGRKFKNLSSRVTTNGTELFFDGDVLDNSLADFILKLLREDAQKSAAFFEGKSVDASEEESQVTWEALVKFLELLYANPNRASQESLYNFISRYGLTIRADGHFIAYKGLKENFGSINEGYGIVDGVEFNGSLPNKPGSTLRFPRKDVNSNTRVGCAQGLHAGTHHYASRWAEGKLVAVAINPTNVVSVPDDSTFQKIRVCEYEILNEVDPLEDATATSGWEKSSSYWNTPKTSWDDNYASKANYAEGVSEIESGDVISFDYIGLDGREQRIELAQVDEIDYDQLKAFVPAKDGYRSFKFAGISNLENEIDLGEDDFGPMDPSPAEEEAPAEEAPAEQETLGGKEFFAQLSDTLRGGGGASLTDFFKGLDGVKGVSEKAAEIASSVNIDELKRLAKEAEASGTARIEELFGQVKDQVKGAAAEPTRATEGDSIDLAEGDTVSFSYTNYAGTQVVLDAQVEDVQWDYFKAFVPAKDGYRSFKFAGVSELKVSADEPQGASAKVRDEFAALKVGAKLSATLTDGSSIQGATVLIARGDGSITVKLAGAGYKVFSADDVVTLTVG